MVLGIYRNKAIRDTIKVSDNAFLIRRFYGENQIVIETDEREPLNLQIGDYVVYKGLKYYLNTVPTVTKSSSITYRYSIVFEAEYYNLTKVQLLESGEPDFNFSGSAEDMLDLIITNLDRVYESGTWTKGTVSITNTGDKLLNFSGEHCRGVLKRICEEFDCEVSFTKKAISLYDRVENLSSVALEYRSGLRGFTRTTESDKNIVTRLYPLGSEKNLSTDYGSTRLKPSESKNLLSNPGFETGSFTGWTSWGTPVVRDIDTDNVYEGTYSYVHSATTENNGSMQTVAVLPSTEYTLSAWVYGTPNNDSLRLMADVNGTYYKAYITKEFTWHRTSVTFTTGAGDTSITIYVGGGGTGWFDAIQLERSDQPSPYDIGDSIEYLERNVDEYGIIEKTVIFDDVYPSRTGTISYVDGSNVLIFRDSGMDFDLNSYLLDGVTAKLHFQTGSLAGYTFDVETYTAGTKQYKLITQTFQSGAELPSASEKPAIGDTYVLLDIKMPTSYINTAEEELLVRAQRYIEENAEPRVTYELDTDPQYFKQNYIKPAIGDQITVTDTDLSVSTVVRVTEIKSYLLNQYKCELVLTNHPEAGTAQTLYDSGADTKKKLDQSKVSDLTKALNNWRGSEELHHIIVDENGYIRIGLMTADNIIAGTLVSNNGNTYFDMDNNKLVIGAGEGAIAGTTINSIEDGADVTAGKTAAGITGQGDMALEDLVEFDKLSTTTIISGGYIKTGLVSCDNINTGTLTGRTVQTASSGQRAVIDGSDNTLRFHTAATDNVVVIDDTISASLPGMRIESAGLGGVVLIKKASDEYSQLAHDSIYIKGSNGDILYGQYNYLSIHGYMNAPLGYYMGASAIITSAKVLQNVTANASIINAGVFGTTRIPDLSATYAVKAHTHKIEDLTYGTGSGGTATKVFGWSSTYGYGLYDV